MISVSEAWKERQQRLLVPESFVEIVCAITEAGAQESASATGADEAAFSHVDGVLGTTDATTTAKYATNELNLWVLDGTQTFLPDSAPYKNVGYVSDVEATGSVTLSLPEVHTVPVPGVTITWSSEYDEYPHSFTVTAKNGDTVVAETTVTGNTSKHSVVDLELSGYDSVTVTVHDWSFPNRRARIDQFALGHILTFGKGDIFNYTHEQTGCMVSGEMPNNTITFSVDNTDGRWNPTNPDGLEKYLSERQRVTVRYGLDIDGTTEWIKAGTFYMAEWSAPSNGMEATFVARDAFEYMLNEMYTGPTSGTLREIVDAALSQAALPDSVTIEIDDSLSSYSAAFSEAHDIAEYAIAEVIQLCANAAGCIFYQDRSGSLKIVRPEYADSGYLIGMSSAYSYPEIELSKQLRSVNLSYGDSTYTLDVGSSGEDQTVSNDFISTEAQAAEVAAWIRQNLEPRKTVSGEFRADPRLDVFDVVTVESKYGTLSAVVTNINYTFTGVFKATYSGRVLE